MRDGHRFRRSLTRFPPDRVGAAAAALVSLILVVAFLPAVFGSGARGGAVAAALAYVVIVACGLYAWRLGATGRAG